MFNIAILTGRLTADPELKTTSNGIPTSTFTIANDTGYGEKRKTAFINIVAWRSTAEFASKHFRKGDMIGIEGSIQTRKYQDKNGINRTVFEVVAKDVQFVESKRSNDSGEGNSSSASQSFSNSSTDDFADMGEVGDEDLPF